MTANPAKVVALGSLAAAAAIAIYAMNYAAGHFEWHPIYLWVAAPYAVFALALLLPWGTASLRMMSGCATALALLIFTFFFYIEGLVRSTSSTSPLILIFAPMYLIGGGTVLWALTYVMARRWARSNATDLS